MLMTDVDIIQLFLFVLVNLRVFSSISGITGFPASLGKEIYRPQVCSRSNIYFHGFNFYLHELASSFIVSVKVVYLFVSTVVLRYSFLLMITVNDLLRIAARKISE